LLQALSRLKRSSLKSPWKLIIAGGRGGDEHQGLLEHIEDDDLQDLVQIVTNRNDVPDLLALADVFVMPSLWEGLPMALLEAMSSRKAIVASATAGIPEAVTNGKEGILVPPGDVRALSDALADVIGSAERRAQLASAAAERANREFTVQVMADRYEALYANPRALPLRSVQQRFSDRQRGLDAQFESSPWAT
jgi:glycosyltransferase involved in cell wall biosynthesis